MLQKLRQLNLTPKLALIFVLFAAILLASVGVFAYYSGRAALQAATISNLLSIANEKEEGLDNWVFDKQNDLIQLAHSPALINQVAILRASPPNSAAAREAHNQLLAELKPQTELGLDIYLELFVIEPNNGQIIASTNPAEEGKFKEDRPYFINGKEGPYVQPPYYSLVRQGPAMTAAVPVRSTNGVLLGVLAGRLALDELNAIVQRGTDLHQTLDVFLVNTSNLFVTQPRYVSDPAVLQRQITRPEINRCLQGENGVVLADDYRGVPAVIVYHWLPDHLLCLKAKLDQAEVFAPIAAFGNELWVIGLLGLLIASAVAMGLARAITHPVLALQQGATRFGRGELDVRLPETTGGELGRLAREFNKMAAALAEKEARLRAHAIELEQKVAERAAALQASEAELRAVFAAMPDVVLVLNREGRYLKVAPTNPSLLYKPPAELIGKTVYDIFPGEQAAAFVDHVHLALEREQTVNYEYELQLADGEIWFAATISPMTADSVVWVARDITGRKHAEEALRESEERFRSLAQTATDAIINVDIGRHIRFFNQAAERIFGYTAAEMIGQPVEMLIPKDYRARHKQAFDHFLETGQPEIIGQVRELTGLRKGDVVFPLELSITKVLQGGEIIFTTIIRDITDRKQAEEVLQRSEQHFRLLIENALDIITIMDGDGTIKYESPSLERILGYEPEALVGKNALDFVHPDDVSALVDVVAEGVQKPGTIARMEYRVRHRDGSWRVFESIGKNLLANPVVAGIVVNSRDVTERKEAEEALQQKLAELMILNAITVAGTEAISKDELIRSTVRIMHQTLYSDYFGVGLTDEAGERIHGHYAYRGSAREFNEITTPLEQGVTGRVIATGQLWRIADITRESAYMELNPDTRSELCVPLKLGERVIGVINAESNRLDAFSEADEQLLTTVAGQVATALDRLYFFETTQRRAEELKALVEVSSALRWATGRADMLPVILNQVRNLLQADGAALASYVPNSGETILELAHGSPAHLTGLRIPAGRGVSGRVLATGQPYVNSDIRTDRELFRPDLLSDSVAVACVPLIAQEQTIGALWVGRKRPIIPAEVRLLTAIADIAANAIRRMTLYEETQRHVQHLTALRNIDLAITTNLQLQAVLEVLLEQVTTQLEVDAADLLLLDSESQRLEYAAGRGLRAQAFAQVRLPLGKSYAGRAALKQRIVNVPNLPQDAEAPAQVQSLLDEGFITYYGVPLVAKGQVEGVLEIFHRAPLEPDPEWLDFLEALSTQAAIAIENARLFEETQEQAHQLEQILDSVPEGVLLLDADQRLILANPTARKYLNVLRPDEGGNRLRQLAERSLEELLQPAADGLGHELKVVGSLQRVFELEARSLNIEPQAGGWVLVIREVTREREIQQRAQQQERLAAVGQLAAGIAHDFNNILTSIIGFAELARFRPNTVDSIEEPLDRVIEQGNRAAHLIRQILDFSRQTVAERQKIDLMPLIKENLKLLKRIISEEIQINLETEPDQQPYLINANPVQIQQMLTNLSVNAQDAMPSGGTLEFRLARLTLEPGQQPPCPELSPGEWIALAVSDTGVGISSQNLPHLFEPFFTTKAVDKGTGLGLAQVYGIVKQHDGEIEVTSQEGEGTTFTIYLPALRPASPGEHSTQMAPEEIPHGQGELILLVEDDSGVRWVATAMLEMLGYQVLTASNGRHALEVYDEHQDEIALVLTDSRMPEMGGVALSKALQKKNPAIKVIAMSGYPLEDKANERLPQNFIKWLQKPLNTASLAQAVSQVLKGSD